MEPDPPELVVVLYVIPADGFCAVKIFEVSEILSTTFAPDAIALDALSIASQKVIKLFL